MRIDNLDYKLPPEVITDILSANYDNGHHHETGIMYIPTEDGQWTEVQCSIHGYGFPYVMAVVWDAGKAENRFLYVHPKTGAVYRHEESVHTLVSKMGRQGHEGKYVEPEISGFEWKIGREADLPRAFVKFGCN